MDFIDELFILLETEELVLLLMLMEPPALTEREKGKGGKQYIHVLNF